MGFMDNVLGRRKPAQPNLDSLFALPSAAITLQVDLDMTPTGRGSVAFRATEGRAFADLQVEIQQLLDADSGPPVEIAGDEFGFTWILVKTDPADLSSVVTDLHAVNSSLVAAGFGPQLLCSLVSFYDPDDRPLALVYLYKRGTFYPFAPESGAGERRDNILELRVRDMLARELPVEPEVSRWFAVWGAPGL